MSVLTGVLKLQDSASEAEIVTAIRGIIANADRLEKENKTLAAAVDKMNEAKKESQKREAISRPMRPLKTDAMMRKAVRTC